MVDFWFFHTDLRNRKENCDGKCQTGPKINKKSFITFHDLAYFSNWMANLRHVEAILRWSELIFGSAKINYTRLILRRNVKGPHIKSCL